MGKIEICERSQDGHPMVMVMNSESMISILSKKRGKRYDPGHDLLNFSSVNPLLAQEIFDRGGTETGIGMSPELESFVAEMWDLAEDLDPWFITDPVEEEEELN